MVCASYAANVLENGASSFFASDLHFCDLTTSFLTALATLAHAQRESAFARADDLLSEFSKYSEKNSKQNTEVMAAVLHVFTKMDSLL